MFFHIFCEKEVLTRTKGGERTYMSYWMQRGGIETLNERGPYYNSTTSITQQGQLDINISSGK